MSVEEANINLDSAPTQLHLQLAATGGEAIEPIDKTVLTALDEVQEDGEPDLVVELIDLYLSDAPQWIEAIRTAAARLDGTLLKQAAHALKGSSGSIGVRRVAEICKMFEHSDCASSAGRIEALLQSFDREFARAQEALLAERQRRIL